MSEATLERRMAALEDAELAVHSFLFTTGAHSFARQMDIPDVSVQTFPMFAPRSRRGVRAREFLVPMTH